MCLPKINSPVRHQLLIFKACQNRDYAYTGQKLTASYPDVSLLESNGRAREEGNAKQHLFFLLVIPRALRSSPVARASRSSREMPVEDSTVLVFCELLTRRKNQVGK